MISKGSSWKGLNGKFPALHLLESDFLTMIPETLLDRAARTLHLLHQISLAPLIL